MARKDKGDFMSRAGKITKQGYRKTVDVTRRGAGNIAKNYKTYAGPTVGMFKKTGSAALGTGKFLVKRGLFGFPGLVAGAGYYGAKAIAKRQKGLQFSSYRQYNKKGRKII